MYSHQQLYKLCNITQCLHYRLHEEVGDVDWFVQWHWHSQTGIWIERRYSSRESGWSNAQSCTVQFPWGASVTRVCSRQGWIPHQKCYETLEMIHADDCERRETDRTLLNYTQHNEYYLSSCIRVAQSPSPYRAKWAQLCYASKQASCRQLFLACACMSRLFANPRKNQC